MVESLNADQLRLVLHASELARSVCVVLIVLGVQASILSKGRQTCLHIPLHLSNERLMVQVVVCQFWQSHLVPGVQVFGFIVQVVLGPPNDVDSVIRVVSEFLFACDTGQIRRAVLSIVWVSLQTVILGDVRAVIRSICRSRLSVDHGHSVKMVFRHLVVVLVPSHNQFFFCFFKTKGADWFRTLLRHINICHLLNSRSSDKDFVLALDL